MSGDYIEQNAKRILNMLAFDDREIVGEWVKKRETDSLERGRRKQKRTELAEILITLLVISAVALAVIGFIVYMTRSAAIEIELMEKESWAQAEVAECEARLDKIEELCIDRVICECE